MSTLQSETSQSNVDLELKDNENPTPTTVVMDQEEPIETRKTKKQAIKEEKEKDRDGKLTWLERKTGIREVEVLTAIAWLLAIIATIWYTIQTVLNFYDAQANPTSSLSFVEEVPLAFPAITICNWNSYADCNFCDLDLKVCTTVDADTGDIKNCTYNFEKKSIWYANQHFRCYVFNNDTNHPIHANVTGYGGSFALYFQVPPAPVERDARFGLQITFHEIGSEARVFEETNFVTNRLDNFFTLTKIVETRLKRRIEYKDLTSTRWDTKLSTVQLTVNDDSLVVVSVAYSTLNIQKVTEVTTSNWENVVGEVSGIIGVLMGIDALKILRAIFEVPYAVARKTFRPIWDEFN